MLERSPIAGTVSVKPRLATLDELRSVHTAEHVALVTALEGKSAQLDGDTAMGPLSLHTALLGAGAASQAVIDVIDGSSSNGFALVRPPGHHAEADHAMGFCLFNNAAIAAETARARGIENVLLLDWDVHHGNGSQHSFYRRRDVMYASAHQHPYYPGTGDPALIGEGDGEGFNVNCGLPPGQTDADYAAVFNQLLLPIAEQFKPGIIIVSAGFDPHRADPLGGMSVTERGFAAMCSALKKLAQQLCGGKIVLLLEGGYDLTGLALSTHACIEVLAGARSETFVERGVSNQAAYAIDQSWQGLGRHWRRPS